MIGIAQFLLGLMAIDGHGRQVVELAMADWRHELDHASGGHRVVVHLRSTAGVGRALANAGVQELRLASASAFIWKLASITLLWAAWVLKDGPPGNSYRFFQVTSGFEAWVLAIAPLIPSFLMVFPLMVFVAEAIGRRNTNTPLAGTWILLTGFVALFGIVVAPLSIAYVRYETWRHFANASVAPPGLDLLGLWAASIISTILVMPMMWVLLSFANQTRRVGGFTGWTIACGALLLVLLFSLLPGLSALALQVTALSLLLPLIMIKPLLMVAVIVLATHVLARLERSRSASSAAYPESTAR